MTKLKKTTRILTNREFSQGGYEAIEINEHGFLMWRACERDMEAAFPVDADFVADKFRECGRDFDPSRLPPGTVTDPYAIWK